MKKIVLWLTAGFVLIYFPEILGAQETILIKKIVIQGNEKTRDSVILTIIRTKEGDVFSSETVPKVQRYLDNQRKFRYVRVWSEIEKDGAVLLIEVKDKWSIVPVPYYANDGETSAYGFAFLESNFLGYQNILLISVVHEYDSWDGTFLFSHPRVLGGLFSYTVMLNKITQRIFEFQENTKLASFIKAEKGGDLNLKYQFYGEHYFMFHVFHSAWEVDNGTETQKGQMDFVQLYLELDWTHYDGVIGHGTWLGLFWEKDYAGAINRNQAGFKLEQYFSPGDNQNLYWLVHYLYAFEISKYFEERIGGNPTNYSAPLRGYSAMQIVSKHALSSSIEYRVSIAEVMAVNISLVPFIDAVLSSPEEKNMPTRFDYTSGLGCRFYFNSILVPAAQVFFGYAWKNKDYALGLTIGTKF